MPLPDNLLNPIPGPNPSGNNLRYVIYDEIKEARREEDVSAQGEWHREIKKADYPRVIELAVGALSIQTKDLQIAAWLTEALLRLHGFPGLKEGLELLRGLVENFWDTLHPELEDGDAEFRAMPLNWVGSRLDGAVRGVPLTASGYSWFQYKESRDVGYGNAGETTAEDGKKRKPKEKTEQGKLTPEAFDYDLGVTKKAFYERLIGDLDGSIESLRLLEETANEKFGQLDPGFTNLKAALHDVKQTVQALVKKKREQEPKAPVAVEETAPKAGGLPPEEEPQPVITVESPPAAAQAPAQEIVVEEPADREDAVRRVVAVARYLRRQEPSSPVPYLMLRGLRWGELRAAGSDVDPALLAAPSTEIRQQLKRLALDGQWQEVLETAETAMGMPCGRAWLDLQRYVVKACTESGSSHGSIAAAVCSELRALLADFPQLSQLTLTDDTPTANAETQAWLGEQVIPPPSPPETQEAMLAIGRSHEEAPPDSETATPDACELATQAARAGRVKEAIEILTQAIAQECSGRARFQRRIELAGICMASGHEAIAYPILEELAGEIERRKLDEWEAPDVVAHPLTLLFRCLNKLDRDGTEKQKVYARICRLDPVQALACLK